MIGFKQQKTASQVPKTPIIRMTISKESLESCAAVSIFSFVIPDCLVIRSKASRGQPQDLGVGWPLTVPSPVPLLAITETPFVVSCSHLTLRQPTALSHVCKNQLPLDWTIVASRSACASWRTCAETLWPCGKAISWLSTLSEEAGTTEGSECRETGATGGTGAGPGGALGATGAAGVGITGMVGGTTGATGGTGAGPSGVAGKLLMKLLRSTGTLGWMSLVRKLSSLYFPALTEPTRGFFLVEVQSHGCLTLSSTK